MRAEALTAGTHYAIHHQLGGFVFRQSVCKNDAIRGIFSKIIFFKLSIFIIKCKLFVKIDMLFPRLDEERINPDIMLCHSTKWSLTA